MSDVIASNNESKRILDVKNLKVSFFTEEDVIKAVNDISYYVNEQEVIAIVGESGSGKSVSQLATIQLVQSPPGKIIGGEVLFDNDDLLKYGANSKKMQQVRGPQISMIFQEPMTSLNPVFTIGRQLVDVIRAHRKITKEEAWKLGIEALRAVKIPDPEERMRSYPFEISGGMRQRVLIAFAVACNSKLIIADEPTTALDVTTQAQVMELLMKIVRENNSSLIIVTHNLGLVSRYAHRIYVMYAGHIVETGTTEDLLVRPRHPYTFGLLKSVPTLNAGKEEALIPIKGTPPDLSKLTGQCPFMDRCEYAQSICEKSEIPDLKCVGKDHYVRCYIDIEESIHD